jgi:type I restriction enzyme R subunit
VPFLFATNGRPFLRQLLTESGIWYLDARRPQNLSRALEDWYTPEGLRAELQKEIDQAHEKLRGEPTEYLGLRGYQLDAIRAVETALEQGKREMLVAMATGTGKTRTCIGLAYRLIKTRRLRRVLFLVDRSALGDQAASAFKDARLEGLQAFNEIFDLKEMKDVELEPDTRLHIATVQSMARRVLYPADDAGRPPVDLYDGIVVDECHRGYLLDRELSDAELTFRDEADYISKYRRVLDHFDAVKIGMTATPALHTTEIFGRPVYQYSYREAVIDGYLVDHEPPTRIVTALAEDGITWRAGEQVSTYTPQTGQLDLITMPDEVSVEVDEFNTRVLTESFNRAVCGELARHIDPSLDGKTMIFCARDSHADTVVRLLKQALSEAYGGVEDDAVVKITAISDKPLQLIRRFKNERLPNIAVTVDLLTTGVDIPPVSNLVFIRRVRSRILYEQMMGRATRLCPEIDKEAFRIFDAVDLYAALEPYTAMKPVVVDPVFAFEQLVEELAIVSDEGARRVIVDQIAAKLQRKKRKIAGAALEAFETAAGMSPDAVLQLLRTEPLARSATWLLEHADLARLLDRTVGDPLKLLISDHRDEVRRTERGYGTATRPEDYLDGFGRFLRENLNTIPALVVVTQRPRELTRQQLKELRLALDAAGYSETSLQTAWREVSNQDVAASIIGFIRQRALGEALVPYAERVERALKAVLALRPWTAPQRKWLERIGRQMVAETVVDRAALDRGEFKSQGGYARIDKIFEGKLAELLGELHGAAWKEAG